MLRTIQPADRVRCLLCAIRTFSTKAGREVVVEIVGSNPTASDHDFLTPCIDRDEAHNAYISFRRLRGIVRRYIFRRSKEGVRSTHRLLRLLLLTSACETWLHYSSMSVTSIQTRNAAISDTTRESYPSPGFSLRSHIRKGNQLRIAGSTV